MTRRTPNVDIVHEDLLLIHPEDAGRHNIAEADWVCIESARGKVDIRAHLSDEVKPGVLSDVSLPRTPGQPHYLRCA
nr:molybdopterin dinucleotide binding domain-containing protein [Haliscomenobacter sp.]